MPRQRKKKHVYSDALLHSIVRLRNQGLTIERIAVEVEVSPSSVQKWLVRNGYGKYGTQRQRHTSPG